MLSDWLYFIRCLSSFSYINYRVRLYAVFDAIFSSANEIFSVNPSANVFICLWTLNVLHKDQLTYSGGTDRPAKLL